MNKLYDYALIIGRFQPLCLNHIELFKKGYELANEIIIGVGTANNKKAKLYLEKEYASIDVFNPSRYIKKELNEYKNKYIFDYLNIRDFIFRNNYMLAVPYIILEVSDIFDPLNYEKHVLSLLSKQLNINNIKLILIGNNKQTTECFKTIDKLMPVLPSKFHASDVREEIKKNGVSNRLGCNLTSEEIKMIISC